MRGIVIAGTHSGVGKTTVAVGLLAALRQKGHRLQPFKVGPDYIDPSYHEGAAGVPSRNLDSWILKPRVMTELFHRAMIGKDLAVIEGMMGLYDGHRGDSNRGSTAEIAKLLGLPVVLVVDASAAARSIGASVLGFKNFDREVHLAGVILNGIAGEKHLEFIRPALRNAGVSLLGYLSKSREIALPERHLGLIPRVEGKFGVGFYSVLAEKTQQTIDCERLCRLAAPVRTSFEKASSIFPREASPPKVAIAIAMDKAFNFYYPDSLDLLKAWGAELIPFSPLGDLALPASVGGVYFGGGFPELFTRELSENKPMLLSVRAAALKGMPVYAECGGLMYLGKSIENASGRAYPMAGVLSCRTTIKETRLTLGYRRVVALRDGPLLRSGESVRGHEFHLSHLVGRPRIPAAYRVLDQSGRVEGFQMNNVLASYIHLHFGSRKSLARNFVASCSERIPLHRVEKRCEPKC